MLIAQVIVRRHVYLERVRKGGRECEGEGEGEGEGERERETKVSDKGIEVLGLRFPNDLPDSTDDSCAPAAFR